MKRFLITMTALVSLVGAVQAAPSATTDKAVHGSYTSVDKARQLYSNYVYGTNVLLVNHSYYPVIVDLPALGLSVELSGVYDGNNVYYANSSYNFGSVEYHAYDSYSDIEFESGYVPNPGTIELFNPFGLKAGDKAAHPHLVVKTKAGL